MTNIQLARPPKTDDELYELVKLLWGVAIPREQVCANHCSPFEAFADAYFARSPVSIWKACVPGDTPVFTEHGPVRADEIRPGVKVWSWDDTPVLAEVTDAWSSGVQDTLVVRTRAGDLTCTANHVVLVGREVGWRRYEHVWVRADEIEPGDMLIRTSGHDVREAHEELDWAELAGMILADGNVQHYKFLIAHHRDAQYMDHYNQICLRLFGKPLRSDPVNRCSWMHSIDAAEACRERGLSGTSHTKRVPEWIWESSQATKIAFLRGFLDGDGTVRKDGVEWYSCNQALLEDIRHLCMSVGVRVGRLRRSPMAGQVEINGRAVTRNDMFVVRAYDLAVIGSNDPKYHFREVKSQRHIFSGPGWVGHRVLSVDPGPRVETFDLTVAGTASFVADGYVVHNSRGFGGKSRTLAFLTLTEAVTLGAQVNLLGGSGAQSQNIHEAMSDGWASPVGSALYESQVLNDTQIYTSLRNGAKVKALMASQRSVRGPHPQRLRMDEIDEMEIEILDSAFGQPMASKGIDDHIVLSSTHQYPDKTMTAMILRAKDMGWPVYEWCWRETSNEVDGWLTKDMITRKRQQVSKRMWEVEYDLQEPTIGSRAFDTECVERMYAGWCTHGDEYHFLGPCPYPDCDHPARQVYKSHSVHEGESYEFEAPDARRGEYVTAADWAKEQDYTVIITYRVDCDPWRVVAYSRTNRKPYPMMVKLFNKRLERFPGDAIHDGTGLGNVINDYIDQRAKSFIMSGRARDDMLSEYVNAVEKGNVASPKIESAYAATKYCSLDDLYGRGKKFHLPDEVCALALGWHLNKRRFVNAAPALDLTNDGSYWKVL